MALSYFPVPGTYYVFVFILIFAVVYAVLVRTKFFDRSDIPALIALAVAASSLLSTFFVSFVITFLPYVLIVVVFVFVVILILATGNVPSESVTKVITKSALVPAIILFILFIFGLIAYGIVSTNIPSLPSSNVSLNLHSSTPYRSSLSNISASYIIALITSPSVLSLIITLAAMALAVYFMTRNPISK